MDVERRRWRGLVLALAAVIAARETTAHEPPTEHISRDVWLWVEDGELRLRYTIDLSERAAMMQLLRLDQNQDGEVQAAERDRYFAAFADELAGLLTFTIDGRTLAAEACSQPAFTPPYRQTYEFRLAPVPREPGEYRIEHTDLYSLAYAGVYRLHHDRTPPGQPFVGVVEAPELDRFNHPRAVKLVLLLVVPPGPGQ